MRRLNVKETLFTAFIIFSLKALIHPDMASVVLALSNLLSYGVLEFFSAQSVERKALNRLEAVEKDLTDQKTVIQQLTLAQGMRGHRLDSGKLTLK